MQGTARLPVRCSNLQPQHFASASVTRDNIAKALRETFGDDTPLTESVLILVPANNSGIRADTSVQRKRVLADRSDELCDAIFGGSQNVEWYLSEDRYEDEAKSIPKPVFSGCDAHSFEQLERSLGKDVPDVHKRSEVTWIKADPTFEGLQQTLVEPEHRVRIQPTRPDAKEPYQYIAKVKFSGTEKFPPEIEFNQNLVSVIGSRSSGKSALLAYTAHAVDADHTIKQQMAAVESDREANMGPAAGLTWYDVEDIQCEVAWGDNAATEGRVIYIPQNSLFVISGRPREITAKIQPTLYRLDPTFRTAHDTVRTNVASANAEIRGAVEEWFRLNAELNTAKKELRDLGDKKAITSTRNNLAGRIETLRQATSLTQEDTAAYEAVIATIGKNDKRQDTITLDISKLAPYVHKSNGDYEATGSVTATIQVSPSPASLPDGLRSRLDKIIPETRAVLVEQLKTEIVSHQVALDTEAVQLAAASRQLREDNKDLIDRHRAFAEIEVEVARLRKQDTTLEAIDEKEQHIASLEAAQQAQINLVTEGLTKRATAFEGLHDEFNSKPRTTEDGTMSFGIESEYTDSALSTLTGPFNVRDIGIYVDRERQSVNLDLIHETPEAFLKALAIGVQKLKAGNAPSAVAVSVLTATPDVRFFATIDKDRIGGFRPPSMTPGKQALFALTLILDESEDKWPLLIDQPEDDLDSRSVFDTIVPYLVRKKAERQIIMVSHNANLVVGADSEQVVVANRHADDNPNKDGQEFDYLTGSLEQSDTDTSGATALEEGGIREHACRILDGGEIAFQKRRDKYKIR